MQTPSLRRSLSVLASVKAHPTTSSQGVRGEPVHAFNLMVAPIDSVDAQTAERLHLESPTQRKQTFAHTNEIIETGMYLVVGPKEYPIKGMQTFPDGDFILYHLILEDVKAS